MAYTICNVLRVVTPSLCHLQCLRVLVETHTTCLVTRGATIMLASKIISRKTSKVTFLPMSLNINKSLISRPVDGSRDGLNPNVYSTICHDLLENPH